MEINKSSKRTLSFIKFFLCIWIFCLLGFGITLLFATNFFKSTAVETIFGNSSWFLILTIVFISIGLISFGCILLGIFVSFLRSVLIKKFIHSPAFYFLLIGFIFLIGINFQKIMSYLNQQKIFQEIVETYKPRVPLIIPNEVFELTNKERINNNLKPLKRDVELDEAALKRAKVIIENNEFAHEATKSGITYTKAIKKAQYWNINYGENLAQGQFTSQEVVDGWMNSEGHRANILNPKYQEIGIATYSGMLSGFNAVVTVQLFGGYEPPNYKKDVVESWKASLASLKNIQPSWQNLKNNASFYEQNKADVDRINELILIRISNITTIVARMDKNQWFTSVEQKMIDNDRGLYNEQEAIATRLNSR